jgi:hypothetical protein
VFTVSRNSKPLGQNKLCKRLSLFPERENLQVSGCHKNGLGQPSPAIGQGCQLHYGASSAESPKAHLR